MSNSRFAVAVHVLALLAVEDRQAPTSSDYLAHSAGTNPVVIRRILGALRQAGLVNSQPGARGGASLLRCPEEITLLDVYTAVGESELFTLGERQPDPQCICGRNVEPVLAGVFAQASGAVRGVLAGITLAQVAGQIAQRDDWLQTGE